MKESFVLYTKYKEQFALLDDPQRGELIMAVFEYVESGTVPRFTGSLKMAFSFIRANLDKDREKWEEVCRKRAAAGRKGAEVTNAKRWGAQPGRQKSAKSADSDGECDCEDEDEGDGGIRRAYAAYYCGNIGKLPDSVKKDAEAFLAAGMEDGAVELALRESVDAGACNWKYAKAVLETWKKEGVLTQKQARARMGNKRGRKQAFENHEYTAEELERRTKEEFQVVERLATRAEPTAPSGRSREAEAH